MDEDRDLIPEDERVFKPPRLICIEGAHMVDSGEIVDLDGNPLCYICKDCAEKKAEAPRLFRPHEDWQQERDYPDGSRTLGRGREITGKYNGRR